jgi:hypothetical protein
MPPAECVNRFGTVEAWNFGRFRPANERDRRELWWFGLSAYESLWMSQPRATKDTPSVFPPLGDESMMNVGWG